MTDNFFQDFSGSSGVRIAVIGTLCILAIYLGALTISVGENLRRPINPATDTITVTGNGEAIVTPDVARITYTVQNTAPTVAAAQEATTNQANTVLASVKKLNINEKDIKTLSYNVSPEYAYQAPCPYGSICPDYRQPKITGYQVSQTVQVTVRDLTKVGTLLSTLGTAEVQNVNGPAFGLDDETAGYNAARADAIAKAKAQAAVLSKQLGVGLGRIVNFSESSGYYPYPMAYGKGGVAMDSAGATPEIPVGENTYNASVTITYEIR